MQIYGTASIHGAQAINAPHAARLDATQQTARTGTISDTLDISETGRLMEMAAQLPEIRADRVEQLRTAIAQGGYDTAEKLDIALDRLLDEIA